MINDLPIPCYCTETKNKHRENAFKEAEEEASIPASMLEQHLLPAGMISYRYQTRHGLSTKLLKVYVLHVMPISLPGGTRSS